MIEFQYLQKGLTGLARAHRANTMAGHLGAAVVVVKAEHDPRTAAYWKNDKDSDQWSANLTHWIKTLYGFFTILRLIDDAEKREKAVDAFGYLMA